METDVALVIAGVVTSFVQVVKAFGVQGKWGMAYAALFSFVGVVLYGVSYEPVFARVLIWKYFTAFSVVTMAAVGVFEVIERTPRAVLSVKGMLSGTGNGSHGGN